MPACSMTDAWVGVAATTLAAGTVALTADASAPTGPSAPAGVLAALAATRPIVAASRAGSPPAGPGAPANSGERIGAWAEPARPRTLRAAATRPGRPCPAPGKPDRLTIASCRPPAVDRDAPPSAACARTDPPGAAAPWRRRASCGIGPIRAGWVADAPARAGNPAFVIASLDARASSGCDPLVWPSGMASAPGSSVAAAYAVDAPADRGGTADLDAPRSGPRPARCRSSCRQTRCTGERAPATPRAVAGRVAPWSDSGECAPRGRRPDGAAAPGRSPACTSPGTAWRRQADRPIEPGSSAGRGSAGCAPSAPLIAFPGGRTRPTRRRPRTPAP